MFQIASIRRSLQIAAWEDLLREQSFSRLPAPECSRLGNAGMTAQSASECLAGGTFRAPSSLSSLAGRPGGCNRTVALQRTGCVATGRRRVFGSVIVRDRASVHPSQVTGTGAASKTMQDPPRKICLDAASRTQVSGEVKVLRYGGCYCSVSVSVCVPVMRLALLCQTGYAEAFLFSVLLWRAARRRKSLAQHDLENARPLDCTSAVWGFARQSMTTRRAICTCVAVWSFSQFAAGRYPGQTNVF